MTPAYRILYASIPIIISLYTQRWKAQDEATSFVNNPQNLNLPTDKTFDFIIVGGGTAGCILANRLSKDYSVLVLEAGPKQLPEFVSVPLLSEPLRDLPELNFLWKTIPQAYAGRGTGGRLPLTAGKMIGGSSSHNHMVWERGNPLDYDRWAEVTKDPSWKHKNIVKYFKKIENFHGPRGHRGQFEKSGLLDITESYFAPGRELWFDAGQELGYKIRTPNVPQTAGFLSVVHHTTADGRRTSAFTAYLQPILRERRRHLKIFSYSFVSNVIFKGKRAIGVEYKRHGVARTAFASKEVILCAGTFLSPIILLRSGIGPIDQVRLAKTALKANLPVGQNLQDHPTLFFGPITVNDPSLLWTPQRNLSFNDLTNFIENGLGPLTTAYYGTEALILSEKSQKSGAKKDWPDIQIFFNPGDPEPNSMSFFMTNAKPLSRGSVTLNASAVDADSEYLPLVNYNYYQNPRDLEVMIEGINFCLKAVEQTKAFQRVGARLKSEPFGPCKGFKWRSTDYWKCFVMYRTFNGFHSAGTCRMGHGPSDPEAVVNSKLKVIGFKGLRVVDASVMPFITTTNTVAPTMLIAEKAADEILKEYRRDKRKK